MTPRMTRGFLLTVVAAAALAAAQPATPALAQEHELYLPIVSRTSGLADTRWRTGLWILNLGTAEAEVRVDWYPSSLEGSSGPADSSTLLIAAGEQAFVEDPVGDLFGVNDNGALRLTSAEPIRAFARVYNDKTPEPQDLGTYGQAVPARGRHETVARGVLLGMSDQPAAQQAGFRTNVGYFNPGPGQVTLEATVHRQDGTAMGSRTLQIPAGAHWLGWVFHLVWSVPQDQRELDHFYLSYEVTGGELFIFSATADNVSGDAVTVEPMPLP